MQSRCDCNSVIILSSSGALMWKVIPVQLWCWCVCVGVCVTDCCLLRAETLQLFSVSTKKPLYTRTDTHRFCDLKLFCVQSSGSESHIWTIRTACAAPYWLMHLITVCQNHAHSLWLIKKSPITFGAFDHINQSISQSKLYCHLVVPTKVVQQKWDFVSSGSHNTNNKHAQYINIII